MKATVNLFWVVVKAEPKIKGSYQFFRAGPLYFDEVFRTRAAAIERLRSNRDGDLLFKEEEIVIVDNTAAFLMLYETGAFLIKPLLEFSE